MESAVLHNHVHTRFREAFGDPTNSLGPAAQWSLASDPAAIPIHVLLNGAGEHPSVWVFDPGAREGSSPMTAITGEEQVDAVIAQIQRRLSREGAELAAALSDHPARVRGFVRAVSEWSACVSDGAADAAKCETEKVRIFGRFLAENAQFSETYRDNLTDDCRSIDRQQGLNCLCTYLNAVAEAMRVSGRRGAPGVGVQR